MFAVKLPANKAIAFKLLHCFLNLTNISEQSLEHIVFIINGCKLLAIFPRVFKQLPKVVQIQKIDNQSRFNGALVIEMINNSLCESNKKYGYVSKWERFF